MSSRAKKQKEPPHGVAAAVTKKTKKPTIRITSYRNYKPSKSSNHQRPVHDANLLTSSAEVRDAISNWAGDMFVGSRVAKPFGGKAKKWFYGTVRKFKYNKRKGDKLWHVQYDDGDREDMDDHAFGYWLNQYNLLWAAEMRSSQVPYRESEERPKNACSKKQRYYKVSFKLRKELEDFGDGAFDDCQGVEAEDCEQMFRESEVLVPWTQIKELYQSTDEANAMAADVFKLLAHLYIDDEDRSEVKEETADASCRSWRWSYTEYDEYENTFLCEGYVEVEEVSNWR